MWSGGCGHAPFKHADAPGSISGTARGRLDGPGWKELSRGQKFQDCGGGGPQRPPTPSWVSRQDSGALSHQLWVLFSSCSYSRRLGRVQGSWSLWHQRF